jgi:hypothetical protein
MAGSARPKMKISKTTPCKVQMGSLAGRWHGCLDRSGKNILTGRAKQGHYVTLTPVAKTPMDLPDSGRCGVF